MKTRLIIYLLATIIGISAQAQKLEPTKDKALLNIIVTDFESKALVGEIVILTAQKDKKKYKGHTDNTGKLSLLVPKGDTYEIIYKNITQDVKYDNLIVPNEEGLFTIDLKLSFEQGKEVVLENVEYDFGKATLRASSYKILNDLVEVMKIKTNIEIEIAGHTDNKGLDETNLRLSQARAESVRSYLISKGILPNRVIAKGYGATMPVAPNQNLDGSDNPDGRQRNRRTEVKIIKE
ncbi:MAG: OmpA family protein [Prevotellaceae bacterium]|jgi:outer membrane protein OmpA-like peptidoglycan-associated protein|nr:OmpA family protein [Prevotellaceae bacterium]